MNDDATVGSDQAQQLRERVIARLVDDGTIVSPQVEAAMRAVPRERFAPGTPLEEVYDPYSAVITKRDEYGVSLSSVSAPQIQAMMLEQADLRPGQRVLEVGSGGYNAALIAEMVGPTGEVTTVDIDPDVTDRARALLAANGYERVRVVTADAETGLPEFGPYDAMIVTVGAWEIPPGWVDSLVGGGRLVVPLRMRNLTRSIGFTKEADHLSGISALVCGFVPMQGNGEHQETLLLVNGTEEIGLRFDDEVPDDPALLDNAVRTPRAETWTGVTVALQEPIGTLQLYLATKLPGFCVMSVDPDLDSGLVAPNNHRFSLAAVEDGNFAYLVTRRTSDDRSVEYGVHAFGPEGEAFAKAVAEHVRVWGREQRGGPGPRIDVFPASAPDDRLPGELVITKRHTRVTFSWPTAANPARG
ncbi:methyltransferase, FxLD system [Nocardiopsis sp. NRRL B-16309]|uniref:methyltransferase, FxLD system n=1 Tax=Nocardiopsis sp. NRRL B-16309 TaxID=1519494 RepID=UPI0006AF8C6B|nr:methyltransferase, FxLD system [Nocardiopsis sp. NRRL B-16309]KOX23805.1 protein-L-isoaspartate O-methyltransferase [Nocardiopsis sp. NRRL B-16309]